MNERKTSTLAIISLVAGICGWTVLPLLGTIAAIITGHMARGEIRRSGGTLDGDGMAMIGLVLGWLQVVITVLGLLFIFLFLGGLAWFASVAS
ncbi:DUF4190 domain-containing protein [Lysobacter brunescens]|uniref:DUF4190 domain-containing protein n=1 Tax=Lysobacter brunescens TaxID=262323 RepID=A0ABW2YF70_9GAMM